jgi:hypothetical protein
MITLVVAAALAAQSPAAPAADPQHAQHMQMGPAAEQKDKDCCKDGCKCCKDMANKHEGHAERGGHAG